MTINPRTMRGCATTISDNTFAGRRERARIVDLRASESVRASERREQRGRRASRECRTHARTHSCTCGTRSLSHSFTRSLARTLGTHAPTRTRASASALIPSYVCVCLRLPTRRSRACLPRFAYVEHGTAIVYCCSFYYPRVMVVAPTLGQSKTLLHLASPRPRADVPLPPAACGESPVRPKERFVPGKMDRRERSRAIVASLRPLATPCYVRFDLDDESMDRWSLVLLTAHRISLNIHGDNDARRLPRRGNDRPIVRRRRFKMKPVARGICLFTYTSDYYRAG